MDITYIDDSIIDTNYEYKYIINIIDHYSKLLGSYLLKSKSSKEVLKYINKFICSYGIPKYIQSDNGKEFINSYFQRYCDDKNIKLIHSRPYHPQTNGIVQRVHREIKQGLLTAKLTKNKLYDIDTALDNTVAVHNSTKKINCG